VAAAKRAAIDFAIKTRKRKVKFMDYVKGNSSVESYITGMSSLSKKIIIISFISILFSGCAATTRNIDMKHDDSQAVMGLDNRDFQKAAKESIGSMIESGAVSKPGGGRYVLVVSRIINDTTLNIDTDQLIKKIRVALLRSGKVVVTTAVGLNGPEDAMSMKARELRKSGEFNQRTVARKGRMIAPDLSLSGKIIQRNIRVTNSEQKVEYSFQLSLSDISSGLALWEGESMLGKMGSNDSVSW